VFYGVAPSFKRFVPNAVCVAKKRNANGTICSVACLRKSKKRKWEVYSGTYSSSFRVRLISRALTLSIPFRDSRRILSSGRILILKIFRSFHPTTRRRVGALWFSRRSISQINQPMRCRNARTNLSLFFKVFRASPGVGPRFGSLGFWWALANSPTVKAPASTKWFNRKKLLSYVFKRLPMRSLTQEITVASILFPLHETLSRLEKLLL